MCGVFGFVAEGDGRVDAKRLRAIAQETQRRGPHAFGFAWIGSDGRMRCYKQTGRIGDHLGLLRMVADARMIVGHTRYATQGDPADNMNNHPHAADGGWIVHNGMIPAWEQLVGAYDLHLTSDCDSETIARLFEEEAGENRIGRMATTVARIGSTPAVVLGLFRRPDEVLIARRGNPLRMGKAGEGIYFGSLAGGLPGGGREFKTGEALSLRRDNKGHVHVHQKIDIPQEIPCPAAAARTAAFWDRSDERDAGLPVHTDAEDRAGHSRTRPRYFGG